MNFFYENEQTPKYTADEISAMTNPNLAKAYKELTGKPAIINPTTRPLYENKLIKFLTEKTVGDNLPVIEKVQTQTPARKSSRKKHDNNTDESEQILTLKEKPPRRSTRRIK